MHVLMNRWCRVLLMVLVFLLLVLITASAPLSSKTDDDPSIKCGECPCVNPCSQQIIRPPPPPLPPPPVQHCIPLPPPTLIYGAAAPPPSRFIYVSGLPGNLYPTDDPFNLQVYSNDARNSLLDVACAFTLVACLALQLLLSFRNP